MIKAIIFDFDGVLVESAQIKTEAFRKIFSRWTGKAEAGVSYHLKNMGISRYAKFKYFYENILGELYNEIIENKLGQEFSEIVFESIKNAPLVKGTDFFLNKNHQKYFLFIASGTPQAELDNIVASKGLRKYFKDILGSPATKFEIVKSIMSNTALSGEEVIFVGDAESDMNVANNYGLKFILRVTSENEYITVHNKYKIYDLTQLEDKIKEVENGNEI